VFTGAVAGFDPPLNAVMMLWVNLIMDTMGALALGTEPPTEELLNRKPYKRTSQLISRPMWRNILCQATFQVILLLALLFRGSEFFNVPTGDACHLYTLNEETHHNHYVWNPENGQRMYDDAEGIDCTSFWAYCPEMTQDCYMATHVAPADLNNTMFSFNKLDNFAGFCLECQQHSYVHTTIIFNSFVFCQLFNEFNARSLFDDINIFRGLHNNPIFMMVVVMTVICQYIIVTFGGDFTRTSPLDTYEWGMTVLFALLTFPVGVLMRFIPCKESPDTFFDNAETVGISISSALSPGLKAQSKYSLAPGVQSPVHSNGNKA